MKEISLGPTCLWNTLKDPSQQARNGTPLRLHPLLPFISPSFPPTNYSHSPWSIRSLFFFPRCTTTSLWFHAVSLCKAVCRRRSGAKSCNWNRCYRQHQDVNNHNSTPNFPLCGFSSHAWDLLLSPGRAGEQRHSKLHKFTSSIFLRGRVIICKIR